jgi:hypothetical protein
MAPAASSRKVTAIVRFLTRLWTLTAHSFILALVILARYSREFPVRTAPQMPNRRMTAFPVPGHGPGWRVLALAAVLLSGCSTTDIDKIPQELGGLPAGAPVRPADPPAYPAVHDMPPQRAATVLDEEQQKRLEADLIALRNRQPNQAKTIAREKAKAEKQAKAKAAESSKGKKRGRRPPERAAGQPAPQSAGTGQPASGTPPWPLPPQTTGGSPRP